MFELIYRSIAQPSITNNEVVDILNTSRQFNAAHGITGCLVFYNHEFVQILEGDKKTVQELYAKIEKDKRHTDVQLLDENEKAERTFPKWSMAFYDLSTATVNSADEALFIKNFTLAADLTEKPTHAVRLFWLIATQLMVE